MTRINHAHRIADIEPGIALGNAFTIEREHSRPGLRPISEAALHEVRTSRVIYLRALFTRVVTVLTSGGLDDLIEAPSPPGGRSPKPAPKSA
jgi:hypothetical protein